MEIKCFVQGCSVSQDSNDNLKVLQIDHIVPKFFFKKNDMGLNDFDMVTINGIRISNRQYLCIPHHNIKTERDMAFIRSVRWFNFLREEDLKGKLYNDFYSEFAIKGDYKKKDDTKPVEEEGI